MLQHRICRNFTDEPVDEATLERLLAAALSTPAKSDLQQVAVIVIEDPVRRGHLADLIPDMPWIRSAPRFLLFAATGTKSAASVSTTVSNSETTISTRYSIRRSTPRYICRALSGRRKPSGWGLAQSPSSATTSTP